jgi:hypothetical protein
MLKYLIRSEGYANGTPDGAEGQFLQWYDPYADGNAGEAMGGWTDDPDEALSFDTAIMAHNQWRMPMLDRENKPVMRPDGSAAERPLTAFNISIVTLEQAKSKMPPTIWLTSGGADVEQQLREATDALSAVLGAGVILPKEADDDPE